MIISAKKYTKKTKSKKKPTDRTLGQVVRAKLYRQNHTKKYTHTHSDKEKREKNIYFYVLKKRKRGTKSINKSTNDDKI